MNWVDILAVVNAVAAATLLFEVVEWLTSRDHPWACTGLYSSALIVGGAIMVIAYSITRDVQAQPAEVMINVGIATRYVTKKYMAWRYGWHRVTRRTKPNRR